jgi:hypothetical protein
MVRFLLAGVGVVYVFDEVSCQVGVFSTDRAPRVLSLDDDLFFPEESAGQSGIMVRDLFE